VLALNMGIFPFRVGSFVPDEPAFKLKFSLREGPSWPEPRNASPVCHKNMTDLNREFARQAGQYCPDRMTMHKPIALT
jgi:hypothetical protein